jgi:OOP family OmpA-OmpF porin
MDVSQRRAESVKAWIVGKGIAGDRITTIGYGPDKPIAPNDKEKNRKKNRRIEFRLVGEQEQQKPPAPAAPKP